MNSSSTKPQGSFDLHLFVCLHKRETGESCGQKNSEVLRAALKASAKSDPELQKLRVRINGSGCLGRCEEGIAAVCYPRGEWLTHLQSSDHSKVLAAIKKLS